MRERKIILATGGTRSGKSSFALSLAKFAKHPYYIATGWDGDEEMAERIKKHRLERGKKWTTIEEKFQIANALKISVKSKADFIIVDCLTVWLSNMMLENKDWKKEINAILKNLKTKKIPPVIFVTNEVGSGIVPADKLSREFRDNAGFVNRVFANFADEVYLCVCGIPVKIK